MTARLALARAVGVPAILGGLFLAACGGNYDAGPIPDTRLTASNWAMTQAKSANNEPIEPMSELIGAGTPPRLSFNHGEFSFSRGIDAPAGGTNVCHVRRSGYRYSADTLTYQFKDTGPTPAIGCDDQFYEISALFRELFDPGAKWTISDATPRVLTLTGANANTFVFNAIRR